jgi:hypothetical protein
LVITTQLFLLKSKLNQLSPLPWAELKSLDENPVFSRIPERIGSLLMTCLISEFDITLYIPTAIANLDLWATITATKPTINTLLNRAWHHQQRPSLPTQRLVSFSAYSSTAKSSTWILKVSWRQKACLVRTKGGHVPCMLRSFANSGIRVEKFRRILSKYGYKYENKQVLLTTENGVPAIENSDKLASTKKAKGKGAPRAKKRKLDSEMAEEKGLGENLKGESE